MRKRLLNLLQVFSCYINNASFNNFKYSRLRKISLFMIITFISCKPAEQTKELEVTTTYKQDTAATSKASIEFSVGPDIEVQDVELNDFNEFEVWVTTKYRDTVGNCKLKKVKRIKGIDSLSHFFVRFKTLPIVYKMKIENNELVFAKINRVKSE